MGTHNFRMTSANSSHRMYSRAMVLSYQRNRQNQRPRFALLKIEKLNDSQETKYYMGKRVAYVYKCKTALRGSHYRTIWGKITAAHGNKGVVRAHFPNPLPPTSFGRPCRVMMYPVAKDE